MLIASVNVLNKDLAWIRIHLGCLIRCYRKHWMAPKERIETSCFEYDLKFFQLKIILFIKVVSRIRGIHWISVHNTRDQFYLYTTPHSQLIYHLYVHITHKVPQCLSPCRNWVGTPAPPPLTKRVCLPPWTKGGDTLACGWGGGGGIVPIRTTGEPITQGFFLNVWWRHATLFDLLGFLYMIQE